MVSYAIVELLGPQRLEHPKKNPKHYNYCIIAVIFLHVILGKRHVCLNERQTKKTKEKHIIIDNGYIIMKNSPVQPLVPKKGE